MRLASKKWLKRANIYWMTYSVNKEEAHKYYLRFTSHQRDMDRAIVVAAEASKLLAERQQQQQQMEFMQSKMDKLIKE
jgi:hypothetical protein